MLFLHVYCMAHLLLHLLTDCVEQAAETARLSCATYTTAELRNMPCAYKQHQYWLLSLWQRCQGPTPDTKSH